ncbi:transposase [Streptomyces sp. BH-SS-21]|uniref:Transposase n=1 Tax=Streptomyces liliiviolaceus TaxID=2823109 RepID=A0A940Y396_9ACTN|nr:transposase [Streptomyces liliiviolaceus]MBQ0853743.1 transposase [Streptomyces liliiviolaceus]
MTTPQTRSSDTVFSESTRELETSLTCFTETIFSSLRRADQRRWAHTYVEALLATPGKKSVRRLAQTVSTSATAIQSLRQLVSLSPWEWDPVLSALTHWAHRYGPDPVCAIGRAVLPKRGENSVGVHRYFDPPSGRTLNGQLGLGALMCFGAVQVPVDWRLHLPAPWAEDEELRRRTRIPDSVPYRPVWMQVLHLVDTLGARTAGMSHTVVADLSSVPDTPLLIHELGRRGRDFVMAVPQNLTVLPAGEPEPTTTARLFTKAGPALGPPEGVVVTAPDGSRRGTRMHTALVHLTGPQRGQVGPPYRLFAEVPSGTRPRQMWVTNLTHPQLDNVASLADLAAGTASSIEHLERDFGLLDFEGRSLPGWYHHMVLTSAACVYERLTHLVPSEGRQRGRRQGTAPETRDDGREHP